MADETAIESGRAAKALKCYFDDKMMGEICRILCANIAKSSSSAKVVGMQIKKIIQRTMSRLKEKNVTKLLSWQKFLSVPSAEV